MYLTPGSIGGLVSGVSVNLIFASTLEGGLDEFLLNTSHLYSVLAGCSASLLVSILLTVLVSLCTHSIASKDDEEAVWTRMRQINNPLHPWSEMYAEEFPDLPYGSEPSFQQLTAVFRSAKITAIVGSTCAILLLVVVVPGAMASLHVLSASQFRAWFTTLQVWCAVMAVVVIIVTPAEELRSVCERIMSNRRMKNSS